MKEKQCTVFLPIEVYKNVEIIANKKKKSVHATMVKMIEEYTNAYMSNKALFSNRSVQSSIDRNSFILLAFFKAITKNDEQFNHIFNAAIDAQHDYGSLDEFIVKHRR